MIRVLIADDHQVVRQGLIALLAQAEDIEVVGEAADGQQAIERARELQPDVILMDFIMPNMDGLRATRQLRASGTSARVIMLSMLDNVESVRESARSGAAGYFLKDGSREELIDAIRAVHAGDKYASRKVAALFLREKDR